MAVPLTLSSVPAQTPYVQYVATAGQTVFPYPFEITQDSDLVCLINGVAQPTDGGYTLSGQGSTNGGNLTFTVGQTAGTIITLYRNISIARITQLSQSGTFFSSNFNNEFNRIYLIMQQLQQSLLPGGNQAYALMIPNSNNPSPTTLLTPAAYANKYLSFDTNGNPQPTTLTSSGSLTATIINALTGPQTAAELAAGVTPTSLGYAQGDVRRYGADPTGVADSTTAIQTAINVSHFAAGANARYVYFADGTYKVSSTINVYGSFSSSGVRLVGQSANVNFTHNGTCFNFNSYDGTTTAPSNFTNSYISGVNITGPGAANTSSVCIGITGTTHVTAHVYVSNAVLQSAYLGVSTVGAVSCYFDRLTLQFNQIGAQMAENATAGPNNMCFSNCAFFYNVQAATGDQFSNGAINFIACDFEANNTSTSPNPSGALGDGTKIFAFTTAGEVNFVGCHFESSLGSYSVYYTGADSTKTLNFLGCEHIATCTNLVYVNGGYANFIGGRCINVSATTYVNLATSTSYAYISGCETSVGGTGAANALWAAQGGFAQGLATQGAPGGSFVGLAPPSGNLLTGQANTLTITFNNAAGTRINYLQSNNAADMAWVAQQAYGHVFYANNTPRMYIGRSGASTVEPAADNTISCGSGALRWSTVYAATGTINTSDANEKTEVASLSAAEKDVALAIKGLVKKFKYKDAVAVKEDKARIHVGVLAQDVQAAFTANGLNPSEYGIFCSDTWTDEEGKSHTRMGVRYEELLAFILGAL